jgi:biopolymer transport protein ExbD
VKLSSPLGKRHSRIEIIPLIDVMFFLLASFMMVSLQMSKTQNKRVKLPPAFVARADFNAAMINIAVDREGGLWLEKKPVTMAALGLELTNRFRADTNLPVYVSADADATHGSLTPLYDLVRRVGVQKISFMVTSPTSRSAAAAPSP